MQGGQSGQSSQPASGHLSDRIGQQATDVLVQADGQASSQADTNGQADGTSYPDMAATGSTAASS
jgi:hypothetical protein